jgi:hypothetical protein
MTLRSGLLVALASLALLACGGSKKPAKQASSDDDFSKAFAELEKNDRDEPKPGPKADAGAPPPEEKKPRGPVYPAPYTAEQLRDATKEGRTYRFKVEVPDKPTKEYAITFRKVDKGGAELSTGGDSAKRVGWLALQQQSEFPKDKVTTRREKLKTPAGKFDCMVYVVDGEDGEVFTYYFPKKLAGAPVFFHVDRDGKRLRTTTLIEYVPGN